MTSGSDFFKNFRISGSLPLLKEINVKVSPVFFLNANAKMPVANILVAVILFCVEYPTCFEPDRVIYAKLQLEEYKKTE